MNCKPFIILALLAIQSHGQEQPKKLPFRDAATNETLTEKYREVSNKGPTKVFKPAEGEDASVKNRVGNLLENSELITYNGNTTLVPKNSIIQIPEKYKERINHHKDGSKIVSWADFYSLNRGWISTVEVTLAQAKAETPINPETLETLSKNEKLVVAVLKNGPISVRPHKVETEETKPKTP